MTIEAASMICRKEFFLTWKVDVFLIWMRWRNIKTMAAKAPRCDKNAFGPILLIFMRKSAKKWVEICKTKVCLK